MIWDEIKKASAIIKDIVYIVGLILAAYLFLGKKAVEKDRDLQNKIALQKEVHQNSKTDSIIITRFNNLSDTLKIVIQKQDQMIKKQNKFDIGFTKHLKQTDRIEELINWYEQ